MQQTVNWLLHLLDHGGQIVPKRHLTEIDRDGSSLCREAHGGIIRSVNVLECNALKGTVLSEEDGVGILHPATAHNIPCTITRTIVFTGWCGTVLIRGIARAQLVSVLAVVTKACTGARQSEGGER